MITRGKGGGGRSELRVVSGEKEAEGTRRRERRGVGRERRRRGWSGGGAALGMARIGYAVNASNAINACVAGIADNAGRDSGVSEELAGRDGFWASDRRRGWFDGSGVDLAAAHHPKAKPPVRGVAWAP